MLHHFMEGERVSVGNGKIVDVDRHHAPCLDDTPLPPGERDREGERAPLLIILPWPLPIWEDGSPSGPWTPWRQRDRSPSEIGSPSLLSSVSRLDFIWYGYSAKQEHTTNRN